MQARYLGLEPAPFRKLFGLPDEVLARHGAIRIVADSKPGFPCRITLRDAEPGDTVLLLTHQHLAGETPYRSSGPIFVREGDGGAYAGTDLPPDMVSRLYSVRAYDHAEMMIDAEVAEGEALTRTIARYLGRDEVAFLHLHHARRGCFACRVERG
ncbi:DUF1203 domain-containing protein [Sphingosinicella sp. BN140058]|uniref:DUF1203 domain-containing protein n=1 Tax=Sphingosinicella sp. BN140058 TaxID=1892855 RepID=UPI001012FA5C|nr:DUF1203 domain-containing protein [Sphingosinicella sp. BN140058]QAY76028.1 DUF1203 domain-containing protein [Sphingosinicella sp. BN140058]